MRKAFNSLMKKQLFLFFTLTLVATSVIACKKKAEEDLPAVNVDKYDIVEQDNTRVTEAESTNNNTGGLSNDELDMLLSEADFNNGGTSSNSTGKAKTGIRIVEEAEDYSELEFQKVEGAKFLCNFTEDASQKTDGTTMLFTLVRGSVSGLTGVFELIVPFSLEWKRGDVAIVDYEVAYPDEFMTVIRDLTFVAKADNIWYEAEAKRKEEERIKRESIAAEEESIRAEEESKAEEERKRQERIEQERLNRERVERQAREAEAARIAAEENARLEQERKAREAEAARLAEEEAKRSKVVVQPGVNMPK